MQTTEKENMHARLIFEETLTLKNSLSQTSKIPLKAWSHSFVQHPTNFPIVNYERVFFWRLESRGVSKALYLMIFQQEAIENDAHYDINTMEAICVYTVNTSAPGFKRQLDKHYHYYSKCSWVCSKIYLEVFISDI